VEIEMDEIVIYPSRRRLTLSLFGSIGFVALGCLMLSKPGNRFSPLVVTCLGWSAILFFGLIAVYAIYKLLRPSPAVVINRDGIFDNASASGAGLIRWDEVQEVFLDELMGNKMLSIVPRDFEVILARQPQHKKYLMRLNSGFVKAPINIPQVSLSISVEALHSQILDFHTAWVMQSKSLH
jgi:hypothetical protein